MGVALKVFWQQHVHAQSSDVACIATWFALRSGLHFENGSQLWGKPVQDRKGALQSV